jgi:hypothetical protein
MRESIQIEILNYKIIDIFVVCEAIINFKSSLLIGGLYLYVYDWNYLQFKHILIIKAYSTMPSLIGLVWRE